MLIGQLCKSSDVERPQKQGGDSVASPRAEVPPVITPNSTCHGWFAMLLGRRENISEWEGIIKCCMGEALCAGMCVCVCVSLCVWRERDRDREKEGILSQNVPLGARQDMFVTLIS